MNFLPYRAILNRNFKLIYLFYNNGIYPNDIRLHRHFQYRNQSSMLTGVNEPIANSSLVRYSMDNLISLHDCLNIPWFAEIALITFMARAFVAFPLTVLQRRILFRYEALKPEIQTITNNLKQQIKKEAYILGLTKSKAQKLYSRRLSQQINQLIERDNCHPVKASLVVLFQVPLWIVLSNCYRNLARQFPDPNDPKIQMAFEQLKNEGALWFTDLTIPDSTGILPIMTCLVNLAIIQVHVNERKRNNMKDSGLIRVFTNGGRIFSLGLIVIGLIMPANMSFYWFISSSFGLAQNILLLNPKVKQTLKLNMNS